jgi:glycosyltransferase involved in cell wall biosynthesis
MLCVSGDTIPLKGQRQLKLSIIMPVYNEKETIEEAVNRVKAVDIDKEIIIVDDCSTDGTPVLLKQMTGIRLFQHDKNMGKGMAIRTALAHVEGDIVVIQDADLEYYPEDYPALIEPIERGDADVVYGSRFLTGKPAMNPANYLANRILAIASNILFGAKITDEATCYKAFRASVIKDIPLTCERFEFCPEVTAKVLRKGIKIVEVPIRYTARTCAQGKKIGWRDGFEAIWTLIKFRFVK